MNGEKELGGIGCGWGLDMDWNGKRVGIDDTKTRESYRKTLSGRGTAQLEPRPKTGIDA